MNTEDTLTSIGKEFLVAVSPLKDAFSEKEKFKAFLYAMGWDVKDLPQEYVALAAAVNGLQAMLEKFINGTFTAADTMELLSEIKNFFTKIQAIGAAPAGINADLFLSEIKDQLFEFLLTNYLQQSWPKIYNLLSALDVIEIENTDPTDARHTYVHTKFKWDAIPAIIQDPLSILKRVYGWGDASLKSDLLFEHLLGFLYGCGFPVMLAAADNSLLLAYNDNIGDDLPDTKRRIKIPFHYVTIADTTFELSVDIMEIPGQNEKLPGLIIQPGIPSAIPLDLDMGNNMTVHITATSDIGSTFGAIIRPGEVAVKYPFSGSNFPTAGFGISFDYHPDEPVQLIGSPDGMRLQMKGFDMGFSIAATGAGIETKLSFEIKELSLILSAGSGDGFLKTLLGDGEKKIDIPMALDWSSQHGFGFRGSANFEIAISPHVNLGPVSVTAFQLSLSTPSGADSGLKIAAAIDINGTLGPLTVSVQGIGLALNTKFVSGNMGPLDIDLGFKPPNGVGISISAGGVTGGGFLKYDAVAQEYSGALELTIINLISAKAIGLITTKMPDGSKGFSLLIIITAEFSPPYQLGYGFTLNAVGGLIGLNRTVVLDTLRDGVRTGAVNHIMFPQNVVANAPAIISDLKAIFPPCQGHFLIGPMAKIGWGTPTLITLSFGLIIEIPGNIAILGVLRLVLPDEHETLINVNVNFVGILDFGKKMMLFDASLFDSRILQLTLEGDMSVRLKWGDDPDFILTVGGFHPQYTPPPLSLPTLKRITVTVLNNSYGKIRLEAYQAITSNTVQFGAKADLFFGLSSFSVQGNLSFDALFQFSPFMFIIQVSGHVSLKAFGVGVFSISLDFSLQGPTPWRAKGTGSISFFFFSISADFDKTWGETDDTSLPQVDALPQLLLEFNKPAQWNGILMLTGNLLVSLRQLDDADMTLLMHPAGALVVQQKLMPLTLDIDKLGNQKIGDIKNAAITAASSAGTALTITAVNGPFALAQYKNMSDADKLSAASFEKLPAGVSITMGSGTLGTGNMVRRAVAYEEIIIDTKRQRPLKKVQLAGMFGHYLKGNAASKSVLSKKYRDNLQPFTDKINIQEENYAVAFADNNALYNTGSTFASEAMATDYLQKTIAANLNLKDTLHVVGMHEINTN